MKVLVVEDSTDMVSLYRYALTRRGHQVVAIQVDTATLDDAARTAVETADVAVIDYSLAEQTGVEALVDLREVRPDLPAVFVTAASGREQLDNIEATGCCLIRKPFSLQELETAIVSIRDGKP